MSNRFPEYGWIFPCSICNIPDFYETNINNICNKCKNKNIINKNKHSFIKCKTNKIIPIK
mgnify:CR=1 FL=1|jgi:hypothetical protein